MENEMNINAIKDENDLNSKKFGRFSSANITCEALSELISSYLKASATPVIPADVTEVVRAAKVIRSQYACSGGRAAFPLDRLPVLDL